VDHFSILNNFRLIKIDTEGYELFVLKGSKNILKITEMIYFEYWEKLTKKYD
jgi:FkbM family methyltransferase